MAGRRNVGNALSRFALAGAVVLGLSAATVAVPGLAQPSLYKANPDGPPTGPWGKADPMFQQPYIDKDEWRDAPVRHHYIHGGFRGTTVTFSLYMPDKEQYRGRFFQHVAAIPPTRDDTASTGTGENNRIAFAFDSGGYLVESNMGGPGAPQDVLAFRASAAVADHSREIAMKLFGGKRPYGYIYGGSGGGFRTMSAVENTTVWDGAVPYVIGSPRAMQLMTNGYDRMVRVLSKRDAFRIIADNLDPGGSGNMYAGLNKEEADALREAVRLGYPIRALPLTGSRTVGGGAGAGGPGSLPGTGIDSGYVADFWTKDGYEGSDPNSYAARHRVQFPTSAVRTLTAEDATKAGITVPPPPPRGAGGGPVPGSPGYINPVGQDFPQPGNAVAPLPPIAPLVGIELAAVPTDAELWGAVLSIRSGAAAGQTIPLNRLVGRIAFPGPAASAILARVKPGDTIQIDNSAALANEVVLRYQVPSGDYVVWDQYRDRAGNPLYPQRPLQPESSICNCGVQNGNFKAKVIVVASMADMQAVPWNADWYTQKVKSVLGPRLDDQYRIWFTDNAVHGDSNNPAQATRIVPYGGILYQALRDLVAWVERGIPPPASTNYRVEDGQVILPVTASQRRGVQPVVELKANGGARTEVTVGQPVKFSGLVTNPPGTGRPVAAEWDFEGAGTFPVKGPLVAKSANQATAEATYTFTRPGTYFAVLRATSQREGDPATLWGRVRNLARARVVVNGGSGGGERGK